jgi:hypothetical protein
VNTIVIRLLRRALKGHPSAWLAQEYTEPLEIVPGP